MISIPIGTSPRSDAMAVLLAELQHATAITKERRRGHWIDVHSDRWRSLLGGNYRTVIAEALRLGYIEVNNRYSVGRFCKSYRLAEKYRIPEATQYRPRRYRGTNGGQRVRLDAGDAVGLKLATCFDAFHIPESVNSSHWDSFCVHSIRERTWYAVRCPYRRLHSTFTGLPKAVRQQMTVGNEQISEVDVANCQPLILGMLAAQQTTNNQPSQATYHMLHKTALLGGTGKYIQLCSQGRIYEYLLDRSDAKKTLSRARVKRQFLVLLFARNEITKRVPLFRVVAREFPAIGEFILKAKREQYQNLARDCQRFESALMIDRVAAGLVERFPIVTIHDSIICQTKYATDVQAEITKQFERLGVAVSVRHEEAER